MSSSMDCSLNVADSMPNYIESDSSANFAYARRPTYIKNLQPPPAPKQSEIWKYPDYSTYSSRLLSFRLLNNAGSSPLCATIFLPTMFACLHTSLQAETHN